MKTYRFFIALLWDIALLLGVINGIEYGEYQAARGGLTRAEYNTLIQRNIAELQKRELVKDENRRAFWRKNR